MRGVLDIPNNLNQVVQELELRNIILSTQQETSIDGILVVDEVATIISYNQRFIELFHIPTDMVSAKNDMPVLQLVTSQIADPEVFLERVNYLYEHREEKSQEEILLKDGRVLDRYSSPMFGSNGKYYGRVWYFRDITERKHAEQSIINRARQLENANAELRTVTQELEVAYNELKAAQSRILQQEKMASIGQLAAGVAHEINNPIGFINSNLATLNKYVGKLFDFMTTQEEILVKSATADDLQQVADKRRKIKLDYITNDIGDLINQSLDGTERVRKIVQDLKSFSRVDDAEKKMANINAGLESTINMVWNELKYKVTLHKELGDIPQIKCYPGRLNQVFMNLLVNAGHAIKTQGDITIKTCEKDGHIIISISDTGCGIPQEAVKRIFEPFFTTKEVGKGTGLGLSIAYDIIKNHRGEIVVESTAGQGATFSIKLPINQ